MNRVLMITGGNSGIELALTKSLLEMGDFVAALDLPVENLVPLTRSPKLMAFPCDVTDDYPGFHHCPWIILHAAFSSWNGSIDGTSDRAGKKGADMKFSAWYGILVGLLMIGQWIFSILSGGVPEFQAARWEIGFHLAAEMATALMLIIGGIATLNAMIWSRQVLLIGLGMVIYSEIVSPGYFAQLGQWPLVVMFAVLLFGAAWSATLLLPRTGSRIP